MKKLLISFMFIASLAFAGNVIYAPIGVAAIWGDAMTGGNYFHGYTISQDEVLIIRTKKENTEGYVYYCFEKKEEGDTMTLEVKNTSGTVVRSYEQKFNPAAYNTWLSLLNQAMAYGVKQPYLGDTVNLKTNGTFQHKGCSLFGKYKCLRV